MAGYLEKKGLFEAFAHQVRLVRGRFGTYEPIDFLALLIGYAISGERRLSDFFERLEPFQAAFMALFGRRCLPHRATLSRFLADVDRPCLEAFRALFEQQTFADAWTAETIGGIFDRQGRRYLVFDVDATRQAARQRALPCDPTLPAARRRRGYPSARLATQGASVVRWFVHVPRPFKCTHANGSAPMLVGAMATIVVNWPRRSEPSRPI